MTTPAASPHARLRFLQLVWGANLISIIAYGALVYFMGTASADGPFGTIVSREPAILALQVISLIIFFGAMAVSRLILRKTSMLRPRVPPTFEVMQGTRNALLIRWAMYESVAILGIFAALTGGSRGLYLPFFLAAFIGFTSSFPSERFVRSAQGEIA